MISAQFVTICAWCPDNEKRTREAEAAGREVTHGICEPCKARLLAQVEVVPERFTTPAPIRFRCRLTRADLTPIAA